MLYPILQFFIRLALKLFCRDITFSNKEILTSKGPLLLACNHPNSFLDAIIIGSQFKQPVHYLARGDAFKNPLFKKFLTAIKLMPIYRLSEGREYLALNDATFDSCKNILLQNGIVLIFSEGLCEHKRQLQPLKKGTARIAISAWNEPSITDSFKVQPVSLNYNSFTNFGKYIIIHFGETITKKNGLIVANEGEKIQYFNSLLANKLTDGMLLTEENDSLVAALITNHKKLTTCTQTSIQELKVVQKRCKDNSDMGELVICNFNKNNTPSFMAILLMLIPAAIGFLLNAPLYLIVKKIVQQKTINSVFYDSVLFGVLLISYPLYWLVINFFLFFFTNNYYAQIGFLLMPFWAWLFLIWKDTISKFADFKW